MPKGVEHLARASFSDSVIECRISDAERRWAQQWELYFDDEYAVSNLWCRKALSTKPMTDCVSAWLVCRISDAERRWARHLNTYGLSVVVVSNLWCRKALSTQRLVEWEGKTMQSVESLMPKGVEHRIELGTVSKRLNVSNLWCRKALSTCQRRNVHRIWLIVSNLWCRKALSTYWTDCNTCKSQRVESLMPKGVEHKLYVKSSPNQ